jgi:recombinational DNA repair protein (RecF pathway)
VSYKTYTTPALVCGSTHSNTSDKSYLLFTREGGMVWASARSVREERSKQRYALQDFSQIRVSLIKGKSGWRIGSVEPLGNPFMQAQSRQERGCVTYLFTQLRRYVHGEVALLRVYDDAILILATEAYRTDTWREIQLLFSVRLLSDLGYIAPQPSWAPLVEAASLDAALALYKESDTAALETAIKRASEASHL